MKANVDLHIHSKYSAATSRDMDLHEISADARKKGVKIMGTGDCLHSRWLGEIRELLKKTESSSWMRRASFSQSRSRTPTGSTTS
jgi:PHP family Zn ribbon phosphoesterase